MPELNTDNYCPDGLTALLDAIGTTIKRTQKRLKLSSPEALPKKVLFVIITDGLENNSSNYSRKQIFNKIKKMETLNQWEFIFLAANQDAIREANYLGINENRAMSYAANKVGIDEVYFSLCENINLMVEEKTSFAFTETQRNKQPLEININKKNNDTH